MCRILTRRRKKWSLQKANPFIKKLCHYPELAIKLTRSLYYFCIHDKLLKHTRVVLIANGKKRISYFKLYLYMPNFSLHFCTLIFYISFTLKVYGKSSGFMKYFFLYCIVHTYKDSTTPIHVHTCRCNGMVINWYSLPHCM